MTMASPNPWFKKDGILYKRCCMCGIIKSEHDYYSLKNRKRKPNYCRPCERDRHRKLIRNPRDRTFYNVLLTRCIAFAKEMNVYETFKQEIKNELRNHQSKETSRETSGHQ